MDRPADSPQVTRRKRRGKRLPVTLLPKLWVELKYAAKHATRVFQLTGTAETVSRNAWIEDALNWALAAYWKDKGGRPETPAEFEKSARAAAAKVSAAETAADAESETEDA